MTDRLQQNLAAARADLLTASAQLHSARVNRVNSRIVAMFERLLCKALDRAWEVQCMANGPEWGR